MIDMIAGKEGIDDILAFLKSRNAQVLDPDGTECYDPFCKKIEHLIAYPQSKVVYEDEIQEPFVAFNGTVVNHPHTINYIESDVLLIDYGRKLSAQGHSYYSRGAITMKARKLSGEKKAEWLKHEYDLLKKFIQKSTHKDLHLGFCVYLFPNVSVDIRENKIPLGDDLFFEQK